MIELSQPRIVCAANKWNDEIVLGPRHHDRLMNEAIANLEVPSGTKWVQGFIDQHCKFYTRIEAWKIAEAAGQIRMHVGGNESNGGTLYSENLY
jgi:hypothetical protein